MMQQTLGHLLPIIPIIAFGLLYLRLSSHPSPARLVRAAVVWAFLLVGLIECLSLFRALTRTYLAVGWFICLVGIAIYVVRYVKRKGMIWPTFHRPRWEVGAIVLTIAIPTFIISAVTLPNTWDGLIYHLPRVDFWIQNRSVEHYPIGSGWGRQNEFQPLAEYIILNFQLLGRTDVFSQLVQWSSMAGSMFCVFAIARSLGAHEAGALLAVLFAATLPMGILQSSSTQNDYVVSFWLLAFVSQFMEWRRERHADTLFFAAGALGLAVLTKGTAFIFAAPFGIWLLIESVPLLRARPRWVSFTLAISVIVIMLPNVPHAMRNLVVYGTPIGGPDSSDAASNRFWPTGIVANAIRDVALQFATPSERYNERIVGTLEGFSAQVGINLQDKQTSFRQMQFSLSQLVTDEDIGINPLHTITIFIVYGMVLLRGSRSEPGVRAYLFCNLAGFLLFAAFIKWQPWANRLTLPGLLIAAPIVGLTLATQLPAMVRAGLSLLLLLAAFPFTFLKHNHPLIPVSGFPPPIWQISRRATMFEMMPHQEANYEAVAKFLKSCGCSQVGVVAVQSDVPVAPLFRSMAEQGFRSHRLEYVWNLEKSQNRNYPLGPFSVDAIVWLGKPTPAKFQLDDVQFLPNFAIGDFVIYRSGQVGQGPGPD
jgi:hypothetical protein